MNAEVQWLAYYLLEAGTLDQKKSQILSKRLPADISVDEFGNALLGTGLCKDAGQITQLIGFAKEKAQDGNGPTNNPFDGTAPPAPLVAAPTPPPVEATPEPTPPSTQTATPEPPPSSPAPGRISLRSKSAPKEAPPAQAAPEPAQSPSQTTTPPSPPSSPAPAQGTPSTQSTSNGAAPAPQPASIEPTTPARLNNLSTEKPAFSTQVPDGFPDFEALGTLSDEDLRQAVVQLLIACQKFGISDVHISAGARPFARKSRQLVYLNDTIIDPSVAERINTTLLSEQQRYDLDQDHDLDFALALSPHDRFRVNVMLHKNGYAGTYRVVSTKISTLDELGFDSTESLEKLLAYHNGLILVTGPVGSGKTTTLAALVDKMNRSRQDHIITVEEPIEIVQQSDQCQVTQREVGSHTNTFKSALKGALRQDPDIIVIGEMRDLETIEMAISASETGHLVIGTMHTSDAATTLNRLLDVFPPAQQAQIRAMVSESLRGIICQRQLPSKNGGVVLASEILLNNTAVKSLIRENKIEGLSNVIETGVRQGMQLMDKSIMKLWNEGKITDETAVNSLVSTHLKNQITAPPAPAESEPAEPKKKGLFG